MKSELIHMKHYLNVGLYQSPQTQCEKLMCPCNPTHLDFILND